MARLVELIYTEEHRGDGTPENPHRMIPQLWSKSGALVAQTDPDPDGSECFYPENIDR